MQMKLGVGIQGRERNEIEEERAKLTVRERVRIHNDGTETKTEGMCK